MNDDLPHRSQRGDAASHHRVTPLEQRILRVLLRGRTIVAAHSGSWIATQVAAEPVQVLEALEHLQQQGMISSLPRRLMDTADVTLALQRQVRLTRLGWLIA